MSGWTVPGYTELRELRTGAQGRVVLAVQDDTNALVDVTYLPAEWRTDSGFLEHFPDEIRRLTTVSSPYLVCPHTLVAGPGQDVVVRRSVHGLTLSDLLCQGALSPEAALVVFRSVLLGLAAAHQVGVVHRACRPENVLVTEDGAVRLVDCAVASRGAGQLDTAAVAGCRAPEQWGGAPASAASDGYAATAVFFTCVTGQLPYPGESATELAVQHITTPIPTERAPEPVRALIRRGLAKDPEQRPESALAAADELAELASAAYGPRWAEHGRRALAARVEQSPGGILPPLEAPLSAPSGSPTLVTTAGGTDGASGPQWQQRRWLVSTALVAAAGTLTVATVATSDGAQRAVAETADPPVARPAESAARPTDPRTVPATPSTTPERPDKHPALSTTAGGSTPTAAVDHGPVGYGGIRGALPGVTPSDPGMGWSSPTPLSVSSLSVHGLRNTTLTDAEAVIEVVTTGTGPVTVTVSWHRSDRQGSLGSQHGAAQTYALQGQTRYRLTPRHTFDGLACYWGIRVASAPAAPAGSSWQQTRAPLCGLP